jgi:L-glyceraldehyde 3-phosphate reductase
VENLLMDYAPSKSRYDWMQYHRCGRSGVDLPILSLGLWHNFGEDRSLDNARAMCRFAFDSDITHFDLANNYGRRSGRQRSP